MRICRKGTGGQVKGPNLLQKGVDIRKEADGYIVTNFESREWLQYTLQVQQEGSYAVTLTPAPGTARISILVDGKKIRDKVSLNKGKHILRVQVDEGESTLKEISFVKQ